MSVVNRSILDVSFFVFPFFNLDVVNLNSVVFPFYFPFFGRIIVPAIVLRFD